MVAGRPSPAPLGPVYPAGSALGGGWGLLWPYRSRVVRWCLDAVLDVSAHSRHSRESQTSGDSFFFSAAPVVQWPREADLVPRKGAGVPKAKKGVGPCAKQTARFWLLEQS